jgi:uncharacterized membrane protein
MLDFFRLLAGTFVLRPYVFTFLLAYLFLAVAKMGWRRTVVFTTLAYCIAWACEWSSIHNGFPFGLYFYIETTRNQELWVAGVPFMDSLSFTFLSYVSFEVATFLRSPVLRTRFAVATTHSLAIRRSWSVSILAAILMTFLDIVIDPVALQGERWFLGKLYFYPDGGSYFGVTIANFVGWFVICLLILRTYLFVEARLFPPLERVARTFPFQSLAPAGLYFGILAFNVTVTFWIGERTMGWASTFIAASLALLVIQHVFSPASAARQLQ